ncbi:MAG: hypothetical protein RI907_1301 [Pseudomonadota bacterium]
MLATGLTAAHADTPISDLLQRHLTVGVWAGAPLGLSGRLGAAWPLDKELSVTAGQEWGTEGKKQFIGFRALYLGHGVGWGGVDLAHWRTKQQPLMASKETDYYGLEAQLLVVRAGVMWPEGQPTRPRLTLGLGISY